MDKFGNQGGFSLTEALVSFSIVGIGLLAVATFQSGLFAESADNKARAEAVALAQQKIEQLKHYTQADEDSYIDENDDGVMDAVGNYSDDPITGQNAVFRRSWELGANDLGSEVEVSVAWNDSDNQEQTVTLLAEIPWISPRTAADQVVDLADPLLDSPTGRARLGEGHIKDIPGGDLYSFPNIFPEDGLKIYQHSENLLLTNSEGEILLTLVDACSTENGQCTDFVRIVGTVYLDRANTKQDMTGLRLLASNAGYCERYVSSGSLENPPTTKNGDYYYYNYSCYLGGGWHGNIGFVKDGGLQQRDKVCQGDPTSLNAWEEPVIALRRAYRGMLQEKTYDGSVVYHSQGIKDAAFIDGQDFVFTELQTNALEGSNCVNGNAPMTRDDSDAGQLFEDVPTDFVCLNSDDDNDLRPDYLDLYDTSKYTADVTCPYDPTNPPVLAHKISGSIEFSTSSMPGPDDFEVLTSDGPGNCNITAVASGAGVHKASYECNVYDWGLGWTGEVELREELDWLFCPEPKASFSGLTGDATRNFSCGSARTVVVQGPITYLSSIGSSEISSIVMENPTDGMPGVCEFTQTLYRCMGPYKGFDWSGTISVNSAKHVCWSDGNVFALDKLTSDSSPYTLPIVVANSSRNCPAEAAK